MLIVLIRALPNPSTTTAQWAFAVLLSMAMASQTISVVRLHATVARYESSDVHGSLPSIKAFDTEPAARWLDDNIRPGAKGRLLTTFVYGSYLGWREPSLSPSIDSRNIFPDSAALPDAIGRPGVHLGPWRSADLAVVPVNYPVAAVLDASPDWKRVGVAPRAPWRMSESPAGLWLRTSWWNQSRRDISSAASR